MKALIITNMFPNPGNPVYGIFVGEQVDALRAADPTSQFDVHFINPDSDGKLVYARSFREIPRIIERGGYDLVHIHYGLSGLFLLNPFLRLDVPVVLTLHGGDIQPEQGKNVQVALTRRILPKVDCAIALNPRMAALAEPLAPRVELMPCAVNTALFTPPAAPRPALAGRRELTVIFPSSHSRTVKNYPLFRAVAQAIERINGIHINEIELSGMSRAEIADVMRRADLLLLTSISEGSPQVVKEAMACNLPVVATPVGDVDLLLGGVENCLVSDPDLLADAVMQVVRGEVPGISGREQIMRLGLDAESTAQRLLNLYSSL